MKKVFLLFVVLLSAAPVFSEEAIQNIGTVLGVQGGRFVMGQISGFRKDRFMLDTQTGRVWVLVADEDDFPKLEPVMYLTASGIELIEPTDPRKELDWLAKWFFYQASLDNRDSISVQELIIRKNFLTFHGYEDFAQELEKLIVEKIERGQN